MRPFIFLHLICGDHFQENYTCALEMFSKLAAQGDASAQYYLGFMYANVQELEQDHAKAVYWLLKTAVQGDVDA